MPAGGVLSGFVETQQQRQHAETIAAGQNDVDEVVNGTEVNRFSTVYSWLWGSLTRPTAIFCDKG